MAKTILVADDSKTIQKAVELTFGSTEYQVVAVGDGQSALARIQEQRPDAVLADVAMPGLDGYDLCAQIKSNAATSGIPVLLLASAFDPFDDGRAAAANADGHIKKPFDTQSLLALVADATGGEAPQANAPLSFAAALKKRQEQEQAAQAPAPEPPAPVFEPPAPAFQAPEPTFQPPEPAYQPPTPVFEPPAMAPSLEPRPPAPAADLAAPTPASDLEAPAPATIPIDPPSMGAVSDDIIIDEPDEVLEEIEVIESGDMIPTGPTLEPPTPPSEMSEPRPNVDMWALTDDANADPVEEIAIDEPEDDILGANTPDPMHVASVVADAAAHAAAEAMADAAAEPVAAAAQVAVPGLPREELLQIAREVIEQVAWEVVPDLAETIIRAELDRLVREEI
ncbi:MAG: response regulator [Deltaproteobacteria bacterium]|jgi:CheY-like chemotaxis protein